MVRIIDGSQFEAHVLQSQQPVVVDVYADWCGPCRMVAPVFEAASIKMASVKFVKINLDDAREALAVYGVSSIPAFLFFNKGQLLGMKVGYRSQSALEREIADFFGAQEN